MTLTELRYLVCLAQEQHFGRAAERCFVSQPTLSIAIKKLEQQLGVAIFERHKNRIKITPVGERIVAQAAKVLAESQTLHDIANAGRDPFSEPLRIGAIYTIGPYLFPHLIPQMQQLAPQMPFYIEENYTAVLRKKLTLGELDVIVISLPFSEPEVVTQTLYDEPLVVLLPAQHALAQQNSIAVEQIIADDILLLGEGHCFRDQVISACPKLRQSSLSTSQPPSSAPANQPSTQRPSRGAEGSSLETLRHMVASGLGITILPQSAAGDELYAASLLTSRPFQAPAPQRSVALAWRTSFTRPPVIDLLNQAIRGCRLFT